MATVKRLSDLTSYTEVLPYASELFGIYQPLLGWKSRRVTERLNEALERDRRAVLDEFRREFAGSYEVAYGPDGSVKVKLDIGRLDRRVARRFDSVLLEALVSNVPGPDVRKPDGWIAALSKANIKSVLNGVVVPALSGFYSKRAAGGLPPSFGETVARMVASDKGGSVFRSAFEQQLAYESRVAGMLVALADHKDVATLVDVFYGPTDNTARAEELARVLSAGDPIEAALDLDSLNPADQEELRRVSLSPISVVHLFRQYFFELDSFLGTPVAHVWLSPGSTVELVEVQTRRTLVEKTLEQSVERRTESVTEATDEEEISEAVKSSNREDVNKGASISATYSGILATASYDLRRSQETSREESHKRTRQQTEKLSSEIRRNYRSTFRTVSEMIDTSSKRYVLANTTADLINYELRRKMRQVAVQVQDVGSYLCWQTYVDRPGASLGIAKLVHVARPADLDGLPAPEEVPLLVPFVEDRIVTIPFISVANNADNKDEVYIDGVESNNSDDGFWFTDGDLEKIQADFEIPVVSPRGGFELSAAEADGQGAPVFVSIREPIRNDGNGARVTLHLDSADFQGQNSLQLSLKLHWTPADGANDAAIAANAANIAAFRAAEAAAHQKAFIENFRDRVKLTHAIRRRPSDDLRDEERIVIYRSLIQDLLTNGISMPDDRTRHVVAELVNSIFDVEKMLYFVAPEWWRPREIDNSQQLGTRPRPPRGAVFDRDALTAGMAKRLFDAAGTAAVNASAPTIPSSTVGWGGVDDPRRDSYFITEDSEPARFGSSLGWLMQLDGDNMRNAFLNAPWVKAVIPIRPGKEAAAINWLQGVEGFNGIDAGDIYQTSNADEKDVSGNPLNGQTMIAVLEDLAEKIRRKHAQGIENGQFPRSSEVSDPQLVDADSVVTSTPIDRVYEHGFYPLRDGFRANVTGDYEIFDQWLEVLPTDQVVPVEVKYDPQTGRQL